MKFLVSYVHVLLLFLSRESIAFTGVEFDQRKHTCRTSSTRLDSLESHFFLGSRPDADLIAQSVPNTSLNSRHSASDWLYNVKSLPQSSVLREIKHPVLAVAGWSLVVSLFHAALKASHSGVAQSVARNICISGAPHSLLVSALGLLLVFRTNSAYQRFNEGRKIWENILSTSRNLSRMIQLYSPEVGTGRKQRIMNLVAAFPYLLRHHVRPGCLCEKGPVDKQNRILLTGKYMGAVETRYEGYKTDGGVTKSLSSDKTTGRDCWVDRRSLPWALFDENSLLKVARAQNRPLWVCDRLGRELVSIPYTPNFSSRERLALLGQVDKLTNAIGECERIHQTAVPLNYARHSLRSLTLWLFTLPFALVKDFGLLTAPVNACIAWLLFGVYQIGYNIEDPFQGSLRLSILCEAIRKDVIGILTTGDHDSRDSAYVVEDDWEATTDFERPAARKSKHLHIVHNGTLSQSHPSGQLVGMNDSLRVQALVVDMKP